MRLGVWDMRERRCPLADRRPLRATWRPPSCPRHRTRPCVVEVQDARMRPSLLDHRNRREKPAARVPGNLLPLRALVGRGDWLGAYSSSTQPADLVRFSLADLRPESFEQPDARLGATRPCGRGLSRRPRTSAGTRSTGLKIQGWLYRPQGQARGTVVYVHGGPTATARTAFNPRSSSSSPEGFNVLDPNYRGSTGFSLAFREAIKEDGWGGREQDDIRAGIEALIARGIAQPGKVGHDRHLLRRLLVVVRHHPLAARPARRRGADLRHDRPGGGLPDHPPRPAPLQRGDAGRLARPGAGALPRALADPFRRATSRASC